MDYKGIGCRIRESREKYNWTIETLAEKINLTPNYLGKIERGEKQFCFQAIVKISNTLNVTLDYLVFGSISNTEKANGLQSLLNKCSEKQISIVIDMVKTILTHT